MQTLPAAFAAMAQYRQFLCHVLVPSTTRPGKMDKFPVSPHTGAVVSAHDPQHWTTAEHACACAAQWGEQYGVAFSFQESDPFFFVDIDGACDNGVWSDTALKIASMFPGAAMELSQSGKGMHIFGTGKAPAHGKKNISFNLEFYTELRFVALTGIGAVGDAGTDHTAALHALTAEYFPANASANGDFTLTDEPVPEWHGPIDDDDLIRRALMSKSAASAFGGKASFADLWHADVEALSKSFPGDPYDASSADAALVSHLSFWTGKHGERILSLMLRSALARDKWDREDYLPRTISEICARPGDVLQDKRPEQSSVPAPSEGAPCQRVVTGQTFLSVDAQRDLFAGCVYVTDRGKVLVPGGGLLKAEQFNVVFGGYCMAMDNVNERTTRKAWEAFTESQVLRAPIADTLCFKPDKTPGAILIDSGTKRANKWWPADIRRVKGDYSPFLKHLANILPNQRDQVIFLSYMAACVQHKGIKFQWCPVLQGVEGNGKTIMSAIVSEAVGQQYTHWLDAKSIVKEFNAYLADTVFLAIEEMYVQEHAVEIVEKLKTVIAGGLGTSVEPKGVDAKSMAICCNVMATTNYKAAVRKTVDNARRFAVFYSAQQTKADIERAGMGGNYFPNLWKWLRADGFAIVAELLHTYEIPPEFNPAGECHRAPDTSTTCEVIVESQGSVEQQIMEVVAQDLPGFMGGWISSVALDRLITETLKMGNRLSYLKRKEMLQGMGYVLHPGLVEGRVNNPVQPDGRKPQLFIKSGHPAINITGAAEIAKAYSAAQMLRV